MTGTELQSLLAKMAADAGSQRALAREFGVSETYISDVIIGSHAPGPKILGPLNLRRVISYEPVRAPRREGP